MWQSQLFWAPAKRARQIRSLDWYTYEQWCGESTISHYQWSNTRNNTFRNARYRFRKISASICMKRSEHEHISKSQGAAELCIQLITSIYEVLNAKGTLPQGYLRWRVVMFCWWISFEICRNGSTSAGLWLVEKIHNLITEPETRASVKTKEILIVKGFRPVLWSSDKTAILEWFVSLKTDIVFIIAVFIPSTLESYQQRQL